MRHSGFVDIAPRAGVPSPDLVETTTAGQHADHARVLRIDVRQQQQGPGRRVGGEHREMRECPYGVVENRQVGTGVGDSPSLASRDLIARHDGFGAHDLVAFGSEQGDRRLFGLPAVGVQVRRDEIAAVRHGEQSNAGHRSSWFLVAITAAGGVG